MFSYNEKMDKIRIIVAEDHEMVRKGTSRILSQYPDFDIVGEAADGEQTLELVKNLHPDIIICDIRMPKLDGIEVVRRMKELYPGVKIMMLSAYDDEDYVSALIKLGVSGYLLKTVDLNELAQAIRAICLGEIVIHPRIASKISRLMQYSSSASKIRDSLSPREYEVLRLASNGLDNEAIAGRLNLSVRTIEGNLLRIYSKFGVSSRLEAIDLAISNNIVQKPEQKAN